MNFYKDNKRMQAIYLTKYGDSHKAFEIRETDKPLPKAHEVLIKVEASGLNFADVMARRGLYREAPPLPALIGYDVAGIIEETGSAVKNLKVGDRVVALTRFGGYAEYAVASQNGVVHIGNMDAATATALATQATTAYYCATESVRLHPGDQVLIHSAAGGVGSVLVQLAKRNGCTVFGTASASKHEFLKTIGVDHPIDYRTQDFYRQVRKITGKRGLDVVFDNIGGHTFNKGFRLLGATGRIVNYGAADLNKGSKTSRLKTLRTAWDFGFYSPIPLLTKSRGIVGMNLLRLAEYRPQRVHESMSAITALVKAGEVTITLGKTFPYTEIAQAHEYFESRKSIGKLAVVWQ